MILLIYASNQYFQYEIILHENNLERIGFLNFLKIRFSQGFTVNKINLGWIGWIISWIIQLDYSVGTNRPFHLSENSNGSYQICP